MWIKALNNQMGKEHLVTIMVIVTLNVFLITFLVYLLAPSPKMAFGNTLGAQQSIPISVAEQVDAPLRITIVSVDDSDPLKPRFNYAITNVSSKPIRAYAIQQVVSYGTEQAKVSGLELSHLPSLSLLLQPNQSRQENGGSNANYPQPVNEIILSVDFVEFTDNMTWGADAYKSSERLAGQRAGGKAAIKRFREKLSAGGLDALISAITQDNVITPDFPNTSHEWQEGFQTGVGIVRNRLRDAKGKGGLAAVREELEKPFDATEGRQQP